MNIVSHTKFLPYQPSWKEKFRKEKENLQDVFGDEAIAIEHIGSTSIEGLSAKPIIDIAVLVKSIDNIQHFVSKVSSLGYTYYPEMSSVERIFLRKGRPVEYHLSITCPKHIFWDRNIIFRDYLRKHPELMREYENLKKTNLKETPKEDFDDLSHSKIYNKGKGDFVKKILSLAEKDGTLKS